jgi:POTRA domain, FtsQ-type
MRKKSLLVALALSVLLFMWTTAPLLLRKLNFFRIHQVEVVGARYLDQAQVVRRLNLPGDASIFDPLAPIEASALAIPGVAAVKVHRRFPGTLRVELVERLPVALVPVDGRLVLLDYRGRLLPFDPIRVPSSLPIADHDSLTAALLARILLTDPTGYDAIEDAHRQGREVLLDGIGHRVLLGVDADNETLRAVAGVREYLGKSGIAWQEIDARFRGRVFVQKAAGRGPA